MHLAATKSQPWQKLTFHNHYYYYCLGIAIIKLRKIYIIITHNLLYCDFYFYLMQTSVQTKLVSRQSAI